MKMKKVCIALVISKWHLYGLESFLLDSEMNSENTDIHVFVAYHEPSKAFRVSDTDFNVINSKKSSIQYIKSSSEVYNYIKEKKIGEDMDVVLVNPLETPTKTIFTLLKNRFNKLDVCIIDEGMGTYVSRTIWDKISEKQNINNSPKLKTIIKKYINVLTELVVKPKKRFLYNIKDKRLILNDDIAEGYKKYFKLLKSKDCKIDKIKENGIILISDNLSFISKSLSDEMKQYKNIINIIKSKYPERQIYLKPHPNEMNELTKFDQLDSVIILDKNISFEDMINNNNIKYIMGFCSTSLLTGKSLFDKESYCLNALLKVELLSEFGKEYTESFMTLTEDVGIKIL